MGADAEQIGGDYIGSDTTPDNWIGLESPDDPPVNRTCRGYPMLLSLLKIGLLVYLGFAAVLYLMQRSLMYFEVPENPAADVASEYLDTAGARLKLWVIEPGRERALIYFGGNGEDVYHNATDLRRILPDHTVYLVNYRGYGGSSGSPSEGGLFADALAIFDTLQSRHAAIDVIGRSLGSGVATYLASQRPVRRLVLATPHDSALAIAQRLYPWYPLSLLLKDQYHSIRHAPAIRSRTLAVLAEHDTMIPAEHAARLVAAFPPAQISQLTVAGAGHNDLSGHSRYWQAIEDFLNGN